MGVGIFALSRKEQLPVRGVAFTAGGSTSLHKGLVLDRITLESFAPAPRGFARGDRLFRRPRRLDAWIALTRAESLAFQVALVPRRVALERREEARIALRAVRALTREIRGVRGRIRAQARAPKARPISVVRPLLLARVHVPSDTNSATPCQ